MTHRETIVKIKNRLEFLIHRSGEISNGEDWARNGLSHEMTQAYFGTIITNLKEIRELVGEL